jgi:hypothetical protein
MHQLFRYRLSVLRSALSLLPALVLAFGDRRTESIEAIKGTLASAIKKTMPMQMPIVTSEMRMAVQANLSSLSVPEGVRVKYCPGAAVGLI